MMDDTAQAAVRGAQYGLRQLLIVIGFGLLAILVMWVILG